MAAPSPPALDRKIGFWGLWALGVGAVVGDGIFLMLEDGIAKAGPGACLAFLVAGLFQLCLMVALGELAVGMPDAGAMSGWVGRLLGDGWGFVAGFAFALGWVFAGGSVGLAIGKFTCWFFFDEPTPFWIATSAIGLLTLFAACNALGAGLAVRTQLVLVLLLVGLMVAFAVAGLGSVRAENYAPFLPHGWGGFWQAVPLGTYAYLGAVTLSTAGGECRDPRDLPRALVWSSLTFLALYTAAQAVLEGVVRWDEANTDPPFTVAAGRVFGRSGAWALNIAGWLAAATTLLMGTLYAPARIFYAQARAGYLPAFLGRVHPRTRTPVAGIAAVWAASVALVLWGVRDFDDAYEALGLQLVFAWMLSWALALVAAVWYRRKCPAEVRGLSWRQPLYPLFPVLGATGIVVVTWFTVDQKPVTVPIALVWLAGLGAYYGLAVRPRLRRLAETVPTPPETP